ncbi:MAG: DUF29 domain-containing protein [Methylobacteriaceae bacterium]|nr:DUF29 domain-containing protein [Methylobacteriaceae bacterium]MBV9393799.1 DUF29 domain-containing protein [Methylobacteriaceae bacterium]
MATPVRVPELSVSYADDLYSWTKQQASLLLSGRFSELDIEHIVEELIGVGNEQYDKLQSALTILLMHLLKWDYQPERRSRSWVLSIREHRRRVTRILNRNPGLKSELHLAMSEAYEDAADRAAGETDLPDHIFPEKNEYSWEAMMTRKIEWDMR